jgi:hypothetical protein
LDSVLDAGVYRLRPANGGPDLVARAFGAGVQAATVNAAARVLAGLAGTPFPAGRCASGCPVLPLGGGRHLLVTEYVEPAPAPGPGFILAWCAGLLARLATRSARDLPSGGGWHRLGATPSREIDEALRLGGQIGPAVGELAGADDGTGLPEALIHADLTPPNAVPRGDQPPVIIDWIGAGRGPRAWPLAFLLFAAGPRGARRGLDRYTRSISLSEEERDPFRCVDDFGCLLGWSGSRASRHLLYRERRCGLLSGLYGACSGQDTSSRAGRISHVTDAFP